ncbi:hypothetical protein KGF54_004453 [Candida jiufengensis]|uniref:uncharacterized protein n=1 Tax=Candida jiufengensis TaxID=497108 RepID=UPI002224AF03|nr:uncharacterized protein KGF54_004453 [Candida jiufengensis]KAI5951379.1 hypothetical protein KGF54_004453 [Candida jiufengensis]
MSVQSSSASTVSVSNDLEKAVEKEILSEDPDIDGGYAWVILAAGVMFNFGTWYGIAYGVGMIFGPLIVVLRGYIGLHAVLILGNVLQFTSLMLASWSTKLWQLYLTQGVMQSFGLAFLSIVSFPIQGEWFKKKRVFANGIAAAGSGLGGIVFNLGMQIVVQVRDVHWALRAQAIIGFGITWIAIFLIRSKAAKHKIEFKLVEFSVFKYASFYLISFFIITSILGYVIVLYTLANWTQTLGYSAYQGSIVSAMVQLGNLIGRPTVGVIADRYGATTVASIAYVLSGIFCLAMWIPSRNYASAIIFAFIEGSIIGSIYPVIVPIITRSFGLPKTNIIFAQLFILMGISIIGVKLIKGIAAQVDPSSYQNCAIFSGIMFFAAAGFSLLLRGYLKARDSKLKEVEDSDYQDYTLSSISVADTLKNVFSKSNEKA